MKDTLHGKIKPKNVTYGLIILKKRVNTLKMIGSLSILDIFVIQNYGHHKQMRIKRLYINRNSNLFHLILV